MNIFWVIQYISVNTCVTQLSYNLEKNFFEQRIKNQTIPQTLEAEVKQKATDTSSYSHTCAASKENNWPPSKHSSPKGE